VGLGYAVASRLAYVLYVGGALRRQERGRAGGGAAAYRHFRQAASRVMTNDGVAFVAACLLGWHTLPAAWPRVVLAVAGVLLASVGVATKLWARATLGGDAYYWANFFVDTPAVTPARTGPYRFLRNPMYTVGYLHTYGLALMTASLPGLIAAAFDQSAILAFHRLVEQPHFDRHRVSERNVRGG
jgi:protein-S-isoprenylcysteine O-methyltransferase Ste14